MTSRIPKSNIQCSVRCRAEVIRITTHLGRRSHEYSNFQMRKLRNIFRKHGELKFARLVEFFGLAAGTVTAYARSIDTLVDDLASAKPHLAPAVPRIYEKLFSRIQAARGSGSALKRALFDWAVAVGTQRSKLVQGRKPVPAGRGSGTCRGASLAMDGIGSSPKDSCAT